MNITIYTCKQAVHMMHKSTQRIKSIPTLTKTQHTKTTLHLHLPPQRKKQPSFFKNQPASRMKNTVELGHPPASAERTLKPHKEEHIFTTKIPSHA